MPDHTLYFLLCIRQDTDLVVIFIIVIKEI